MRLFVVCLLLGCALMACAEIIPCGSANLKPGREIIATRLEPGRVVTDVLLSFSDLPANKSMTLALPLDTLPRVLQSESIDESTFDGEYTGVIERKRLLQSTLEYEDPSGNVLASFGTIGLGPLFIFSSSYYRTPKQTDISGMHYQYPHVVPINTKNLRPAQFLDYGKKLALIQSGVLPTDCANRTVALFNLTRDFTGRINLHLHLEQAASTETGKTAIFPHGITTHWWRDISSISIYADCPDSYHLYFSMPSEPWDTDEWQFSKDTNRPLTGPTNAIHWDHYTAPVLFINYAESSPDRNISLSLVPYKPQPKFIAVTEWLLDFRHTLFLAILAFLVPWGLASVTILMPAWQHAGHQRFPLKISLACMGMAFLWPFTIMAIPFLFVPGIFWAHNGGVTVADIVHYFSFVITVIVLFILAYVCTRYYRRIFTTGSLFWRAWSVAFLIYILLGACCWGLAYFAEHVAMG